MIYSLHYTPYTGRLHGKHLLYPSRYTPWAKWWSKLMSFDESAQSKKCPPLLVKPELEWTRLSWRTLNKTMEDKKVAPEIRFKRHFHFKPKSIWLKWKKTVAWNFKENLFFLLWSEKINSKEKLVKVGRKHRLQPPIVLLLTTFLRLDNFFCDGRS